MKVVVALGGNAISRRGEAMTIDSQRRNIRDVAPVLAAVAREQQLVITHGNGPQVGQLALHNHDGYPLDVLGAETQGLIGYLIEIEMRAAMAPDQMLTTVLTLAEVDADDPAFANPAKFVGPVYREDQTRALQAQYGWTFALDGNDWRRVVPSPVPRRVVQIDSVKQLLAAGHMVISTGGGGIPVVRVPEGGVRGVEAVVDKDASSSVLASAIDADVYVMATDADAVQLDWGLPTQRAISTISVDEMSAMDFAAGSMGPKVTAACDFVRRSGHPAVIGRLSDLEGLLSGAVGTTIIP